MRRKRRRLFLALILRCGVLAVARSHLRILAQPSKYLDLDAVGGSDLHFLIHEFAIFYHPHRTFILRKRLLVNRLAGLRQILGIGIILRLECECAPREFRRVLFRSIT